MKFGTKRQRTKTCKACWNLQVPIADVNGAFSCIVLSNLYDRCFLLQKLYLLRKPLSICWHKHNVRFWLRFRSACNDCRRKSGCFVFCGNKTAIGPYYFTERAATYVAYFDVFDEVLKPIFQEGYSNGMSNCSSSMEYLCISTSVFGRDLSRKPAHKLFATEGPDMALSLE